MKSVVKLLLSHISLRRLGSPRAGSGICLLYHRITTEQMPRREFHPNRGLAVHAAAFEAQISHLSRRYVPLSISDAIEHLTSNTLPKNSVVVTFDDGYRDNLTLALPILERYQVPAAVFVTTGFIDGTDFPWWYELEARLRIATSISVQHELCSIEAPTSSVAEKERAYLQLNAALQNMAPDEQQRVIGDIGSSVERPKQLFLSREELRQLAGHPLVTIGAHTRTHPVLSRLDPEQLTRELSDPERELEAATGKSIEHLAYPFGKLWQAGEREFAAVQAAGYCSAWTTEWDYLARTQTSSAFALPRIPVTFDDSLADFRLKVSGWRGTAPNLR